MRFFQKHNTTTVPRFAFLLLLFTSILVLPGYGQSFFDYPLPEKVEESKIYQDLLAQKEQQWLLIQREIARAARGDLPAEAEEQLRSLAVKVLTGQREAFMQQFDAFCQIHGSSLIDTALILGAQRRVNAVDLRLQPFRRIQAFSEAKTAFYPLDTTRSSIREELDFYEVKPGQQLAEIGAGDGRFAATLMAGVDSLTLFVNDIDSAALVEIAYHIQHNPLLQKTGSGIYPILGASGNPGLGNTLLNKVVIRNAFHHFSHPQDMLQSIREALLPEGRLYIKERYLGECREDCCEFAMEEGEVKAALRSGGFHLLEEQSIIDENGHRWHLMQWGAERVAH